MKRHPWTTEQVEKLKRLYADMPTAELAKLIGRKLNGVYAKANALGLEKSAAFKASVSSGRIQRGQQNNAMRATQFKPGQMPWNKGSNYVAGGRSAETRFKPGSRPHTWVPVGSYRVTMGQLERKVNDLPDNSCVRWHSVSRLVWEAAHGPVPAGHIVIFRPGQRTTVLELITLDRLECISRAENAQRNHPRNLSPEYAKLVHIKGQITRQVNRISRESTAS